MGIAETAITDEQILSATRVRLSLERVLDRIITEHGAGLNSLRRNRSARETYYLLLRHFPDLRAIETPLNDTLSIVNAVLHGRPVDESQVTTAVELGNEVVESLEGFYNYLDRSS